MGFGGLFNWFMEVLCDLQVDVNGQEIFRLDKNIICSFSGRLNKIFGKSTAPTRNCKVIFNDFPGGAESFELITKFCYNNGSIEITPNNISLLNSAAHFMEMKNLIQQTEKSIDDIKYWTWSELLFTLKQFEDVTSVLTSSRILKKCLDSLVDRLAFSTETSPCPSSSSPDSSAIRLSTDSRSTESLKHSFSRTNWWFEELSWLSRDMVEVLVNTMTSRKVDHGTICKFLFYYQKSKFSSATSDEKLKIIETVINLLSSLDPSSVSCKSLFGILGLSLNLNMSKCCRHKLENMVGHQMDQATLDNLLIPSPVGSNYLYDVNLVLRCLKNFLRVEKDEKFLVKLRKIASLINLYIAEVAPDPCLKPSKFMALITVLPDSARDSYDGIYYAMEMYLEVHPGLSREEKMKICCAVNYDKLSPEACVQLAQNPKFPSKSTVQALLSQKLKLQNLIKDNRNQKTFIDSPGNLTEFVDRKKKEEQIVLYARKLDSPTENENLRAHLQGMQWRVMELENLCKKMQTQMTKMMKSRLSSHSSTRSLPRLCS